MKALIRHQGETVLSTSNIDGIDWTTGAPLTNLAWAGGAYALCEDCPVNDPEPSDFDITEIEIPVRAVEQEDGIIRVTDTEIRRKAKFNTVRYEARKQQEQIQ